MIKKAIVAIVVIVAAAAIVFAALPADQKDSTNSNSTNSNSDIQKPANNTTIADNNIASKSDTISAAEAKKIAGKYINEPGAIAGTPKLSKINGNLVYIVPVIYNGKIAGEIDIDAQSGKNVGGAGGAP